MKKRCALLKGLLFALLLAPTSLTALSDLSASSWRCDYSHALERARSEDKLLLLFFTGSDWSGWSMKVKREVVDSSLFVQKMSDHFLFVEVDFPASQPLAAPLQAQNEKLKRQFCVQEYPRLLVVDGRERELARYGVETRDSLIHELTELVRDNKALAKAMQTIETARFSSEELESLYNIALSLKLQEEQERLLALGMASDQPHFFLTEKYRLLAEEGESASKEAVQIRAKLMEIDPDNRRGCHLSLALIDFQARESSSYDRREIIRPIEEYLDRFGMGDGENRWRLEMMVAQFYLSYDESVKALVHAELAFKAAPSERKDEIEETLGYIRKQAHVAMKERK